MYRIFTATKIVVVLFLLAILNSEYDFIYVNVGLKEGILMAVS
jgi:hypothetical protein